MKLKRLSSLLGLFAALLIFTGGRALAADAFAVADAQAFPGGSDTVDVLITSNAAYPGAEVTLSYDATKLTTAEANVIVNPAAWNSSWGTPQVSVDTTAGTVTVAFYSSNPANAIPQSSSALKLFSVVFEVDSSVAVGSYAVTPSGNFVSVVDYETTIVTVSNLTAGSFVVQSLYNMSVDSVDAGPGVLTPVGVNLSNGRAAVSVEFTIAYDSSQVVYADSIEINDLYEGGSAAAPQVIDHGDSLTVSIYTMGATATIPVSNTERWLVKVYFITATGATESASNPLTLTGNTSVVTSTGAPDYDLVDNVPNMVHGNFNIQSKYSLRVGDGAAPQGGRDTVSVYLRSAETVNALETVLYFDSSNFSIDDESIVFNNGIFAGSSANISVVVNDTSVSIMAIPSAGDSIAASNNERLLFTAIVEVKETATIGYDSINVTGMLTVRDENYDFTEIPVTSTTKGPFRVVSPYEIEVQDRVASPEAANVPVSILLTNEQDIYSLDLVVKYDTTMLTYVDGSVAAAALWSGTAPVPDVTADGDSLVISMIDFNDFTNKITGGGASNTLLTIGFDVKVALATGDSTLITLSGLLAGRDGYDPVEYTPAAINGYLKVTSDIVPPDPVSNVSYAAGTSSIVLNWRNPSDSDLDYVKVVRNSGADSVTVVMRGTPVPGATDTFEDVTVAAGVSYYYTFMVADNNGNMGNTVVVGPVSVGVGTTVRVSSATALAGGVAIVKIKVTNPLDDVAGIMLKLDFDTTMLRMTDMEPGPDVAGLDAVAPLEIDSINAKGQMELSAIDASGSNPALAGATEKTVMIMYFAVDSSAATAATSALTLSEVSMSDPAANTIELAAINGTVTIVGSVTLDMNNDGSINLSDLWYYVNREELVPFEALAHLVGYLLAQPGSCTMLAAAQDATATYSTVLDGSAVINLKTQFEITAARFTFSYDRMQELSEVYLNQALAGSMILKKVVANGKLYVDVISLGGFVPAEVGDLFSVAFLGVDHETAGLTLDKVEVADRNGNVTIEAVQDSRVVLPKAFALSQNSPNPFNPSTTIKYQVPEGEAAKVKIVVYNVRGQKVITLVDELKESGDYTVNWNGTTSSGQRVASGIYFYRMSAGDFTAMRKMVIVK